MVDVSRLFATGERLARQAIDSGGTTVAVQKVTTATDPDTLEQVETVETLGTHPALVVPVAAGTRQVLPGIELRATDWRVIMHPDVPPPPDGHRLAVLTSRDPHLPGTQGVVLGTVVSSAGAVLTVFVRP